MRGLRIFILLILSVVSWIGCATVPLGFVPVTESNKRIDLPGFSILPPRGENWFMQGQTRSSFGKKVPFWWKPHTVIATARFLIAEVPTDNSEKFIKGVKQLEEEGASSRFKPIDSRYALDNSLGLNCVRYDNTVEDRGVPGFVGSVFIMDSHGLVCPHPDNPKYLIEMMYSQRIPQGKQPLNIATEGELFLKGLIFNRLEKPLITAVITVGKGSQFVAAGQSAVYVSNTEGSTVSKIDPNSNEVVAEIPVGKFPLGIGIGKDAVWVANWGDGTISRVDPGTNKVSATVSVGRKPGGVAIDRDSVWVTNFEDGTVSRIDPGANKVVATIQVGKQPTGIAVSENAVYVANQGDGTVSRIDPETNQIIARPIPVGRSPHSIIFGMGALWIVNEREDTVSRIDPKTNRVVATIPVGKYPSGLAVAGDYIWVSSYFDGTVWRIDPLTNQIIGKPIIVGIKPIDVAVSEKAIWIAIDGAISRIDR